MNAAFNIELYKLLADWNPMDFEDKTMADQEIYDCMDIIHQKKEREETIHDIQSVYQYAFDKAPAYDEVARILNQVEQLNQTCEI
ncbi:DUF1871 family protein [Macrococcus hajekii]|uniref:DUF1871 family protein n=1 Tax=Macrococcus hajekii TaxID=198482 RepID=A0A4R6BNN2_9STAP|nr:DUF1871 family protein [Macrococcus hajekii]TDM03466.1 DUF1871 family protein [Macrococcus hajekii]GGA99116.1 hypothetical protein GCM10007190_03910 [Macrococcus hajekii]